MKPLGIVVNKYRGKKFEIQPGEIAKLIDLPLLAVTKESEDFVKSEAMRKPFIFYKRNKSEEFMRLACQVTGNEYRKPNILKRIFSK